MAKYERGKEKIDPEQHGYPSNVPDALNLPQGVIVGIFEQAHAPFVSDMVESLKGNVKREHLGQHARFCLPLTIANQTGYIIRAPFDFTVRWDGGAGLENTVITKAETHQEVPVDPETQEPVTPPEKSLFVDSHFGNGIVTLNVPIQFRTPRGVNMYIGQPPNFYIDGISWMAAMVETDQLRRNFTFNLKITRANADITIRAGEPVAWMMPYPRYFFDSHEYQEQDNITVSKEVQQQELDAAALAAIERTEIDSKVVGQNGYRYLDGVDIYGNRFPDHQTKILAVQDARNKLAKHFSGYLSDCGEDNMATASITCPSQKKENMSDQATNKDKC